MLVLKEQNIEALVGISLYIKVTEQLVSFLMKSLVGRLLFSLILKGMLASSRAFVERQVALK